MIKIDLKKILIYAACVYISTKFCAGYWVVGPVFGVAFVAIRRNLKKISARDLIFIVSSTATYALVYWISENRVPRFENDVLDMLAGSLTLGVVAGSLILPLLQQLIYGAPFKNKRQVISLLIASWYGVQIVAFAGDALNIPGNINYMMLAVALWQGIYLRNS